MTTPSVKNPQKMNMPPRLNNGARLTATVSGVTIDGFGTIVDNGITIHIPDTAPGDVVTVRIEHLSRQASKAWARLVAPPQRGDKWKRHFCAESEQAGGRCGGCPLGHVTKDIYREVKLSFVAEAFNSYGIGPAPVDLIGGNPKRYRNKSNFVVHHHKKNGIHLGSWAPRSHRFAEMDNCAINTRPISNIQRDIQLLLTESQIPVHPEPGGLRYVTIKSFESGATLVDLVVNSDDTEGTVETATELMKHPLVHGVSITCNPEKGNQVRTTNATEILGRKALCEQIGDVQIWMKGTTFFQLNNEISQKMYAQAADWCSGAGIIWDLYCGVGGLGLTAAAQHQCRLYGCDSVSDSIALACKNAAANNTDAFFEVVDLSAAFPDHWPAPDIAITNPPRRGIDPHTMTALRSSRPQTLIYMSCNPTSFARDARTLCDNGYTLTETQAFDMLPNTSHVEILGKFET